jgi:Tol biopolymer transport system component
VEAGRLRDRLGAYYEAEGGADPILISLPKGRYLPEFTERRLVQSSGAGVLRLSVLPPENATFESFAVSPDGRNLAFTAALNGRIMLWVRALDSLEAKLLAGTDNAAWPFWSPDSRSIGFFVPNKLKAVEISGGPAREIADVVVGKGAAWSPDGVILFCPRPIGILYQVSDAGGRRFLSRLSMSRARRLRMDSRSFCRTAITFCIWRPVRVPAPHRFAPAHSIRAARKCS